MESTHFQKTVTAFFMALLLGTPPDLAWGKDKNLFPQKCLQKHLNKKILIGSLGSALALHLSSAAIMDQTAKLKEESKEKPYSTPPPRDEIEFTFEDTKQKPKIHSAVTEDDFTLEDIDSDPLKSKTKPKVKTNDKKEIAAEEPKFEEEKLKEKEIKKKNLIEKLKKELAAKPKTEPPKPSLPPLLEFKKGNKKLSSKVATSEQLNNQAIAALKRFKNNEADHFNWGVFFSQIEAREKIETEKTTLDEKEFDELSKQLESKKSEYRKIAENTRGTGTKKIKAVMKAVNQDFVFHYLDGHAHLIDLISGKGGNCFASTRLITTLMKDLNLKPDEGQFFAVQLFDGHIQPVLYDARTDTVTSLVNNSPIEGLVGPLYHPEVILSQYLESQKIKSPVSFNDFLIKDMPRDLKEKALAELKGVKVKTEEISGYNSKIRFPSIGVAFKPPGSDENPREALIGWQEQNTRPVSAQDRFVKNSSRKEKPATTLPYVAIAYEQAQKDARAIIDTPDFKRGLEIYQNPLVIVEKNYSHKQVKDGIEKTRQLVELFNNTLKYTNINYNGNRTHTNDNVNKYLEERNPEALLLDQFQKSQLKDREFLHSVSEKLTHYLNLQEVIGGDNFKTIFSPLYLYHDLRGITTDPKIIGFQASYQKTEEGEAKESKTDLEGSSELKEQKSKKEGYGEDIHGITQSMETKAAFEISARSMAESILADDTGRLTYRWTPALTAAIRLHQDYSAELVEGFVNGGYKMIRSSRDDTSLVISGPDGAMIPKDLAVLIVDFLQKKDGTGADLSRLTAEIHKNHGSVEKYIDRVKKDFKAGTPKISVAQEDTKKEQNDLDTRELFKKIAKRNGIDPRYVDKANPKSFLFKRRDPETFMMGSPESEKEFGRTNDEKYHKVTLTKTYDIALTPVTQLQWYLVMVSNPSTFVKDSDADGDHQTINRVDVNMNHPVEGVSWTDTQNFISKLNALDGRCEYRLPSEAEWEAAARAKTSSAYPWGNDDTSAVVDKHVWYSENSNGRTHAVALKPANNDGLYDMIGNVSQWTSDRYGDYDQADAIDPKGPQAPYTATLVIRGACWSTLETSFLRSAFRNSRRKHIFTPSTGFRLVRMCP